jgi:hypothetical protein
VARAIPLARQSHKDTGDTSTQAQAQQIIRKLEYSQSHHKIANWNGTQSPKNSTKTRLEGNGKALNQRKKQ